MMSFTESEEFCKSIPLILWRMEKDLVLSFKSSSAWEPGFTSTSQQQESDWEGGMILMPIGSLFRFNLYVLSTASCALLITLLIWSFNSLLIERSFFPKISCFEILFFQNYLVENDIFFQHLSLFLSLITVILKSHLSCLKGQNQKSRLCSVWEQFFCSALS